MKLFVSMLALSLLLAALPLAAHHAFAAEFDVNQPVKVKGTVTKVEWVNPHAWLYVDVKDDAGKVAMPGNKGKISPEDIKALVKVCRDFKGK